MTVLRSSESRRRVILWETMKLSSKLLGSLFQIHTTLCSKVKLIRWLLWISSRSLGFWKMRLVSKNMIESIRKQLKIWRRMRIRKKTSNSFWDKSRWDCRCFKVESSSSRLLVLKKRQVKWEIRVSLSFWSRSWNKTWKRWSKKRRKQMIRSTRW